MTEFKRLLEEMALLAARDGSATLPFKNANLSHFSALPHQQKLETLKALQCYLETMLEARSRRLRTNAPEIVETMLAKMEWHADKDLSSLLDEGLTIEIYNRDSQQVFRNLEFFRLTSRSLEELCTVPWFELWERDSRITQLFLDLVKKILNFEITGTMSYIVPDHEVREIETRLKAGKFMGPQFVSPLYDKYGHVAGYITTFRASPG